MQKLNYIFAAIVSAAICIGLGICFYIAGTRASLTNSEALMLSTLVSFFSIVVSWLATHAYSQFSNASTAADARAAYNEKMQTFGRKAAEKVFNLSNELDRLSSMLRSALEESEEQEKSKVSLIVLREKMSSTLHVLETLKSVNDTSLSDWRGVIGEDIELQQNLQKQIDEIYEQLIDQRQIKQQIESSLVSSADLENTEKRIEEIEKRLGEKVAALPFSIRLVPPKPHKQDMVYNCPACNATVTTRVRPRRGAKKFVRCGGCKKHWLLTYTSDAEFETQILPEVEKEIQCVLCNSKMTISMPEFPGATLAASCPECECTMNVSKTKIGIAVHYLESKKLPDKFLERNAAEIPDGDWPSGLNDILATKMNIHPKLINLAIKTLLRSGRVKVPVRGSEAKVLVAAKPEGSNGQHA